MNCVAEAVLSARVLGTHLPFLELPPGIAVVAVVAVASGLRRPPRHVFRSVEVAGRPAALRTGPVCVLRYARP